MLQRNTFLEYMADLNRPYKSTRRKALDRIIDHWLIKFAAIAFLFLLARCAADSLAMYCQSIDLFTKLQTIMAH